MTAFLWFAVAVLAAALLWSEVARKRADNAAASYKKHAGILGEASADANKRRDAAEAEAEAAKKRVLWLEKDVEADRNRLRMFGDLGPVREELEAYKRCFGAMPLDDLSNRLSMVDALTKRQNELVTELQSVTGVLEHRTKQLEESRFQEEWAKNRRAVADAQNVVLVGQIRELEADLGRARAVGHAGLPASTANPFMQTVAANVPSERARSARSNKKTRKARNS
jgi:hypothetical protein